MNNKEIAERLRGLAEGWLTHDLRELADELDPPSPPKKVIDLSVLIESGIDCEFTDHDIWSLSGRLVAIENTMGMPYKSSKDPYWEKCRPRMNHVHAWMGGKCPLPEGLEVKCYFREEDDNVVCHDYAQLRWTRTGTPGDIIAFEVLGKADESWLWPWESE